MIKISTLTFLKDIELNNHKVWFDENRDRYDASKKNVVELMREWEILLNQFDVIESKKLFRINRDIRFSKNKTPYKNNFSGYYKRLGASRRGSFYFQIQPDGNTQIGGGFYGPNKEDLLRIRKEFEADSSEIEQLTKNANFVKCFGTLRGKSVATAPRDFDKEHPNIQWIRMKQFYAYRSFDDEEILKPNFSKEVIDTWRALLPFFNYMSDVLTTDLNGESIL
jgi:uncharacterized protein (TIGR02453 family)